MTINSDIQAVKRENAKNIGEYISQFGIDSFGIANLDEFRRESNSTSTLTNQILGYHRYAIVLGVKLNSEGEKAGGTDTALFLEKVALKLMLHIIEEENHAALIVHTEDEFDPVNRKGMMPLKALAKCAGLGWQGRSLLIVSPEFGPLHRLIAILTDMPLVANDTIANQCGDCYLCIEKCPTKALKTAMPYDHPEKREDVLDIQKCKGDYGCKICLNVCPWIKKGRT